MDRLHELDYAVVGEEAAVSEVQEALAGRFGNPQGNRKPLVMLLLGPPGKRMATANCFVTLQFSPKFHERNYSMNSQAMARPTSHRTQHNLSLGKITFSL
jgi:hypothetical protein